MPFDGSTAANPEGGLVADSSGNLYGVTSGTTGGSPGSLSNSPGAVFEVVGGASLKVLAQTPTEIVQVGTSQIPYSGYGFGPVAIDSQGDIFGAAGGGGGTSGNQSVIFEVPPGATTATTVATLSSMDSVGTGVVRDSSGNLYFTGFASGNSALFELPSGSGSIKTVATLGGSLGTDLVSAVLVDSSGNIYGTAIFGGDLTLNGGSGDGTVWEVAANSSSVTVLGTFEGASNGANPRGLVMDSSGDLYGLATGGGANNDGTVYEVKAGTHSITTMATFNGTNGSEPLGALTLDAAGNLFGTTGGGGDLSQYSGMGVGTVFELPAGSSTITTIAKFEGTNGEAPNGFLVADSSGNLWGATTYGGPSYVNGANSSGYGTVFEVTGSGFAANTPIATVSDSSNGMPVNVGTPETISVLVKNPDGTRENGGTWQFTVNGVNDGSPQPVSNGLASLFDGNLPVGVDVLGGFLVKAGQKVVAAGVNQVIDQASAQKGTISLVDLSGMPLSSNYVVYNSPDSAEPLAQSIGAMITNGSGVPATFTIQESSSGTGAVQLSMSQVTVAADSFTAINVTATEDSSTLNDVKLQLINNGNAVGDPVSLTVASVEFPRIVTAADTPVRMLTGSFGSLGLALGYGQYRLAPNVKTAVNVMVQPSGVPVLLSVAGQSADDGTVAINGLPGNITFTQTKSVNLTGLTQTTPGNAGNLYLTATVGVATIQAIGFSVAAIPTVVTQTTGHTPSHTVAETDSEGNSIGGGGIFIGSRNYVQQSVNSDSGNIADLEALNSAPIITAARQSFGTGVFKYYAGSVDAPDPQTVRDFRSNTELYTANEPFPYHGSGPITGIETDSELFTFSDPRTGATNIPVPQSGFLIVRTATYDKTQFRPYTIAILGVPDSAAVDNLSSSPGMGEFLSQEEYGDPLTTTSLVSPGEQNSQPNPQPLTTEGPAASPQFLHAQNLITPLAVGAAAQLAVTSQPPASFAVGTPFNLAVQAQDSSGNAVTSFNGTVTLSLNVYSGDPTQTIGGTLTAQAVNGVATFSGLTLADSGIFSIEAAAAGLTDATSNSFTVASLPASSLTIGRISSTILASSPFQFQAAAVDDSDNIDTSFNGPVTVSLSTNPTGATLGGTLTVNAVNGIAAFSDLSVNITGSGYVISVSGDGFTASSDPFDVNGDRLVMTSAPLASANTGQAFALTVQAENASGAVDTGFNGEIDLALDGASPDAHLGGVVALDAVNGVASFSGLVMTTPGAYKIVATAPGAAPVDSQLFEVSALATQLLGTIPPPSAVTAGAPFEVDFAAFDANDNIDDSFSGDVTLSIGANPGGAALGGTTTVAAVNGVATFTGLSLNNTGAGYTLTASAGGLTSAATPTINVTGAGHATQLVVTTQPAASATAGAALHFVVKAEDGFGTVDTSFTGAVTVSDPNATLNGTLSANAVGGVATFNNVQIDTAGSQSLVVSGGGLTAVANLVTINPAADSQLIVAGPSRNPLVGGTFGFDVAATDSFGNIDPNFTGAVTLSLGANPGGSTLGGTLTANAVNADANFTGLTLNNAGTGYTLQATAGGLTAGTSQPFDVTADQLVVTTDVAAAVGQLAPINAVVSAENGSGTVDPSFTGAVTASLVDQSTSGSPTTATLGGTLTVNAVAGVATFSGLTVDTPGDYSLTFTAGGVGQASSGGFTVTSRIATTITLSAASPTTSFGTPNTFTATVSAAGGGMTGVGTVTFYSEGNEFGSATVGNNGMAVLSANATHSGVRMITAVFDGNINFQPSTSSEVDVTVGPSSTITPSFGRFVFPLTAVAGQPIRANVPVVLSNGGSTLKGSFTVQLLLDASSTPDANAVQVAQLTPHLSIAGGRSAIVHFIFRSLSAAVPPGTYYIIARITDPTGGGNIGASASTLVVEAPSITLGAIGDAVKPGTVNLNKFGVATVQVIDTGNIDATGTLVIVLSPSSDGATPVAGITLGSIQHKVHLRHGPRFLSFAVRFKVTSALPAAIYEPYFSISLGNVVTTAVGAEFTAG